MFSVNYHQGTSLLLKSLNSPYCLISLVFKIFHLSFFFFFVPKLCLSTFSAIVTLTISIIHPPNTTLKTSNLVSLCCVLSDIHSLIWQKIYVPFKAQSIRHFLVITSIITRSSLYFHSKYCIHTLIMLFNSQMFSCLSPLMNSEYSEGRKCAGHNYIFNLVQCLAQEKRSKHVGGIKFNPSTSCSF